MSNTNVEDQRVLFPLLKKIISLRKKNKTIIVSIQGGQGTGKTSVVRFLQKKLERKNYKVTSFSIDDFYTSDKKRHQLRKKYKNNPYYQIPRGLPGTHRTKFLNNTLKKIKRGKDFDVPIFNKALHHAHGDISKKKIKVKGRQDFVLFEGWCLNIPTISTDELSKICEKNKINLKGFDPKLKYSSVIIEKIKKYQPLWKFTDFLIMLKPKSSSLHKKWRYQQEQGLKKKTGKGMTKKQIEHFVDVFLPFTYVCYEKILPDAVFSIDKNHTFYKIK